MLAQPEPACLLIADISGYTSYLAGAELDHAQDVLADLMTTVVGALRPGVPAREARGRRGVRLPARPNGSTARSCSTRWRGRTSRSAAGCATSRRRPRASATRASSCRAWTSRSSSTTGRSIRHRIAGREELVGSDVIVAHRLLKNHVVEAVGRPRTRCSPRRASRSWTSIRLPWDDRAPRDVRGPRRGHRLGPRPRGGVGGRARASPRDRCGPRRRLRVRGRFPAPRDSCGRS